MLDAGYDLENDYDGVMRQLNEVIGLARVKAIHVNDSQFGLGSHKDRHANIGEGQLGIPFFTRLVNDPTMAKLPMILETKEQTRPRTATKSRCCAGWWTESHRQFSTTTGSNGTYWSTYQR